MKLRSDPISMCEAELIPAGRFTARSLSSQARAWSIETAPRHLSPTAERLARGLVHRTPVRNAIEERGGELERTVEAVAEALARNWLLYQIVASPHRRSGAKKPRRLAPVG